MLVCVVELSEKMVGMNGFDKELHVATVATVTIIINYANDVAGVWDRVVQHYPITFSDVTRCNFIIYTAEAVVSETSYHFDKMCLKLTSG